MTANGPNSDWPTAVVEYLSMSLPTADQEFGEEGWQDKAMTAWQFGCMALIALGWAEDRRWGAARIAEPKEPAELPRWDDICRVVLSVLHQRKEIDYRLPDGSVYTPPVRRGQFVVLQIDPPPPPPPVPNIAPGNGGGPARVSDAGLEVLKALGLVDGGVWTRHSELVLWREKPRAWDLSISDATRFLEAIERCIDTMPQEILEALSDLVEITDFDVDEDIRRHKEAQAETIAKYPAQARSGRTFTRDKALRSLIFRAESEMNDLFYAGWRLEDGWLTPQEKSRALPLFHDRLAHEMRAVVMEQIGLAFPEEVPE